MRRGASYILDVKYSQNRLEEYLIMMDLVGVKLFPNHGWCKDLENRFKTLAKWGL